MRQRGRLSPLLWPARSSVRLELRRWSTPSFVLVVVICAHPECIKMDESLRNSTKQICKYVYLPSPLFWILKVLMHFPSPSLTVRLHLPHAHDSQVNTARRRISTIDGRGQLLTGLWGQCRGRVFLLKFHSLRVGVHLDVTVVTLFRTNFG